jgi:FkbM family methyltransferase
VRRPGRKLALPRFNPPDNPNDPWLLGETPVQSVRDTDLGTLLFPNHDNVMAPLIDLHGTWEPEERAWLEKTLETNGVFLNVGANVGYHAVIASKLVGPGGRVFAVEPDPVNFQFLLANLVIHDVRNVTAIECAAGSRRESLPLYRGDRNVGDNRLVAFPESPASVKVRVRRLDELLPGVVLDAALIDTQGWDDEVVAGMGSLLDGLPPMLVEFTPAWVRERGLDPTVVVEGFQRLGYQVRLLGGPAGASAAEVVSAAESEPFAYANLELSAPINSSPAMPPRR